ncbi:hypothetical protein [Agromyces salentinus]|uniref:Acetone carboxylase n=1 Tax=Agromyces salentinus TaxID=269421 RepID=A0ABN2MY68_9MICO|nr:hypothetical protein [Agromyces salentinus]
MIGGIGDTPQDVCSRAACQEGATWRIDWQNPRIHLGDRWKTWLACDEHVDYLRGFLEARSFPVRVEQFSGALDGSAEVDS